MERVTAIDDAGPAGRGARELDRGLDQLRAGVCKEHLVEMRNEREQPLGQNSGKRRDIHLHEVRQVGIERALERRANRRVVAAERKDTKSAQQIEIALVLAIIEVLPASLAKSYIIADRPQHTDHLLIETARMQAKSLSFVGFEEGSDIDIRTRIHVVLFPGSRETQPSPTQMGSNAAYLPKSRLKQTLGQWCWAPE